MAISIASSPLAPAATCMFRHLPLTSTFDLERAISVLSLDWVLTTGIRTDGAAASGIIALPCIHGVLALQMTLPVVSSLTAGLVLGQDWSQFCLESVVPQTCFHLSSGPVDLRIPRIGKSLTLYFLLCCNNLMTPAFTEPSPAFPGPASTYVGGPNLDLRERGYDTKPMPPCSHSIILLVLVLVTPRAKETQFHLCTVNWFTAYPKEMSANKLPFGDSSTAHHMIIAARCTTGAPKELADMFGDLLAVADKVHEDDISKEQANCETFSNIVEWVVRPDGNLTEPGNIMLLQLPPVYEKPCKADDQGRKAETTPTQSRAQKKEAHQERQRKRPTQRKQTIRIGDTYDPDLLPDHRGPYFTHQVSKLVQHDHIDADEKFIAPHELYSQLTEGTLFCAYISFETFIFKEGKYPSKVLDKGYGRAWFPPITSLLSPSGPSMPTKRHREPESDHNDVDDAFNNFSPKKNKTK
ncbi:hypothetical protein B0H17DRAFT_1179231 [Mycena rosella]|uniref:Uncharacterized protein n=1 Tax=Mycena rosella TaxID=1033263 RepID=A0AAD7DJH1_MYCRO|nr:hypothetical protein B0H17DRAFT_1179231 [Mycena rosella]